MPVIFLLSSSLGLMCNIEWFNHDVYVYVCVNMYIYIYLFMYVCKYQSNYIVYIYILV